MYLDRILYPVVSLGPGNRLVIWTAGCNRRCRNCSNPELWHKRPEQKIEIKKLAAYINSTFQEKPDGITITGGEPFDQSEDLIELIDNLNFKAEILVFSGYPIEELQGDSKKRKLLKKIDVLIDGDYVDELNDGQSALRGSSNQKIHFLNEALREKYEVYMREGRKIQNFVYDYKTISVGIHNRSKDLQEEKIGGKNA